MQILYIFALWLTENTECKKSPKIRHLGTIAQLGQAISLQLRHVLTIGKKLVKQHYVSPTCPYHMVNFGLLAAEIVSLVWGPLFQRVSCLGSITARHFSSGRQRNFAALNRRCHLYSAGQQSCCALAILVH